MKPTLDPTLDYKRLVAEGYNACADAYQKAQPKTTLPAIKWLKNRLPNRAHVLDVGCGSGLPVTHELAKRFLVTGVDISAEQINRARKNVRHAEFFHSDIMALDFPRASFDAVVALYVIFHIPRSEHNRMFRNLYRWLKPGGYLLASLTYEAQEDHVKTNFFDAPMYWSNYGMTEYRAMLAEAGFEIISTTEIRHGGCINLPAESYPLVICRAQ